MTLTEIKKKLYKQKPTAFYKKKDKEFLYYECVLWEGYMVNFKISLSEGSNFDSEIASQLLIRWIELPKLKDIEVIEPETINE